MRNVQPSLLPLLVIIYLTIFITNYDAQAASDSSATPPLHFDFSGMFGGKLNPPLLIENENVLRNHGYFYSCANAWYQYHDWAVVKTRLRLLNEELSSGDDYLYQFEPEVNLFYKMEQFAFSLRGGYISDFTLGQGLTIKNLSQSGGIGTIGYNTFEVSGGVFALGYGQDEDLYWLSAKRGAFPLKLSAFLLAEQGFEQIKNRYYATGYILPGFEYAIRKLVLYAEYGYKVNKSRKAQQFFEESPKRANAGLVGMKTDVKRKRVIASGSIELRASQKGFIPNTGNDMKRFSKFWYENHSRANWVDFFDSNDDFYWAYANFDISLLLSSHWSVFCRNELLYFYSKQKELIFYPETISSPTSDGAIIRYKPSTYFYNTGMSFSIDKSVSVEASVKNKLISGTSYAYTHNKVKQRFFASNQLFFEVRAIWDFGGLQ